MRKVPIMILMFLVLISFANAAITDDLKHRFPMTANESDAVGAFSLTNAGVDFSSQLYGDFVRVDTEKLYSADTSTELLYTTMSGTGELSVCVKFNPDNVADHQKLVWEYTTYGLAFGIRDSGLDGNQMYILIKDAGGTDSLYGTTELSAGTNYSACFTYDDTTQLGRLYLDGNLEISTTNGFGNPSDYFRIGCELSDNNCYDGQMREFCIWDRNITIAEINSYTTNGCVESAAPPATPSAAITCTQNLSSYTNSSENPLYFGLDCVGNVEASTEIFNITMYLNDTINTTIYDFNLNDSILTLNLTYGDEQLGYDINITVDHGEDNANYTTEIVDVFLDSVTPYITFYSPAVNGSVYYKGFDSFVNVTVLCDDPNLFSCNLTIMRVNDTGFFNETLNNTFYENITTPNQSIEILRSVQSFADGQYVAIAESADSHTAAYINEYKTKPIQDGYEIEDKIKITSPDLTKFNLEKKYDRYEFDMDFSKSKPDIYVECDDLRIIKNSKYKGHLICWEQKKWIDFEDGSKDPVIISRVSKNKVKVTPQTTIKQFEFKSIGDLNINKVIRYFNVTQNNFAFNIWIYDEDNPSNALPADAEVEVEYYVGSNPNATYYYADLSGGSNYAINISSNESLIRAFVYIKHESENGFVNRYFAVNTTYNTTTGYNFTLYNFNTTTDISGLKITARNFLTYNYYPSVIGRLQRKYVSEGVWRTVQQDQSGDFGVLYFNVREAEVDYRIIFIDQDNNVLKTTDTLKFICTDDLCDLTTLINPYETTVTTADITAGYIYDNATKIINFTWTNNDGDTSTVRMRTRQDTASGATYPCDITQTAAAGSYSCNMTGYSGLTEITIIGDGDILLTEWISIEAAKLGDLIDQREGALWTALILILCATFGIFSPSGAIITSIIGLILVYLLGIFTPLTITIIIIATVIGIAIGFKVRA